MERVASPSRNYSDFCYIKVQCRLCDEADQRTAARFSSLFGKDQWTDKPARFFVNEIIREKILLYYDKEIPYSVEVVVEEFKEEPKKIHIRAVINVERDSQKGIIIGKQGKALKKVATEARRELERFFGKTIFLETYVKVDKDWRSSDKELRNFGYQLD